MFLFALLLSVLDVLSSCFMSSCFMTGYNTLCCRFPFHVQNVAMLRRPQRL